jgi:hypothetical protein
MPQRGHLCSAAFGCRSVGGFGAAGAHNSDFNFESNIVEKRLPNRLELDAVSHSPISGAGANAAEPECGTLLVVHQETKMTGLDEARRQDLKQEPADELDRIERHELLLVPVGGVSPAEGHLALRISIKRPLKMATRCV